MVRTNTVVLPGSDAAVVRIKKSEKLLAAKTDCNSRYVYLNPRKGAAIAVAESGRNVVCSGGKPIAITNCLNFGNPYKPEVYWQFTEAIAGIGEACLALETPVTGGNVSFYNESAQASVFPTPVIGMLGVVENESHVTTSFFKQAGDAVYLLGTNRGDIGGSEFLVQEYGLTVGDAPYFDLAFEVKLQECTLELIQKGYVHSAHDVSDGGLIIALIESAAAGNQRFGFDVNLPLNGIPLYKILFGEEQSRIIISADASHEEKIRSICTKYTVPLTNIGVVTANETANINGEIIIDVKNASNVYFNTLQQMVYQK
jgi:phosphoribosylformylglycinamidine synthase